MRQDHQKTVKSLLRIKTTDKTNDFRTAVQSPCTPEFCDPFRIGLRNWIGTVANHTDDILFQAALFLVKTRSCIGNRGTYIAKRKCQAIKKEKP